MAALAFRFCEETFVNLVQTQGFRLVGLLLSPDVAPNDFIEIGTNNKTCRFTLGRYDPYYVIEPEEVYSVLLLDTDEAIMQYLESRNQDGISSN